MKHVCISLLALTTVAHAIGSNDLYEKKVKPALEAKCIACHKADNKKGGFDLTTSEGMRRGGDDGEGLIPGKPDDSPVYTRSIPEDGKKPEMPKKGEALSKDEAEALRQWIADGAVWPANIVLKEKAKADKSFWSFQPLLKALPPAVPSAPPSWQSNPVDRFVFAKLQEKGLKPQAATDPRSFIRRASFDLLGLPPSPEEVEAFVSKCGGDGKVSDKAVEDLIDNLLTSPHYGERWGRHWLDVVRFGESRGYERNQIITNLWPFRDYVIKSFNDDKPFDQFIQEHLAGDVLGKGNPEIEIGSAFLVAGPYDDVGNQDPVAAAQIRADQMDEMVRATGEAFLGVTIGCARCHDHKFDPLLAKDYYALYATFAGTKHGERKMATAEQLKAFNEATKNLNSRRLGLVNERDALSAELDKRALEKEDETAKMWVRPKVSRYGTEELFEPVEARYVRLTLESSDTIDFRGNQGRLDEFEVWTGESTPRNVALASNGATAQGESDKPKDFAEAYDAGLTIDGKFGERWKSLRRELLITLAKPERIRRVYFSSDRNHSLPETSPLTIGVGEYRIHVSMDGTNWTEVASSHDRTPAHHEIKLTRLRALVTTKEETQKLDKLKSEIAKLDAEIAKVPPLPLFWVGNHEAAPGPFHVFLGGSPQRKGEEVKPASLSVFNGSKSSYTVDPAKPESERRLALAQWITAADNPLPPRVLANRIWHYHFGTGLVDTPSDFGYMGSRPTHPELLDWLAGELQSKGWKLKPLHRLIMTSQAYRQGTAWNADAAKKDGDSRYLWRFPPQRLDAEEVRDTLLSVAGKLDLKMGGPGFKLYDYLQDNVATYVPLNVHGPDTYRRAVYHHNARAARVDVMTDFDCPDPAFSEPRRASTTTPLQALTLMNHAFSLDMAKAFGERLEHEAKTPQDQVRRAFALCYARSPDATEIDAGVKLIKDFGLRAFCRALLNSSELINLN